MLTDVSSLNFSLSLSLSQVDVASLITRKLLRVSMKHIEIISKARQRGAAHVQSFLLCAPSESTKPTSLLSPDLL